MNLLLDTHFLIWAAFEPQRIPMRMRSLIEDPDNTVYFSIAGLWEVTVKHANGHKHFPYEPHLLRRHALHEGYRELAITGDHALQVGALPLLHRDPFDRILIAQAQWEGFTLLTVDRDIRQYPNLNLL